MVHLIVELSKYLMILLFLIYTYECFHVFRYEKEEERKHIYHVQRVLLFVIHFDAFLILYLSTGNRQMIGFYLIQLILLLGIILSYHLFYQHASELVLNNMCMLISIGFIILTRISFEQAFRQFIFVIAGFFVALLIPVVLQNMSLFRKLTWVYVVLGIGALGAVAVAGKVSYGAKLSLSIGGISIQPSEFVKLSFVFFVATMFYRATDFPAILRTSVMAAAHVLVLVLSRDLGSALIFFVTYVLMLYLATGCALWLIAGFGAGSGAAVLAYHLFSHVRIRVEAWQDPFRDIAGNGYQVAQALFAIGTGGWFGMGLYQGMPRKIPVVEKDFIFAAISEELGGLYALCIILICLGCFLQFMQLALKMDSAFYRQIAFGLGIIYIVQVLLTIGGVIKFIPSTGVTLPFVSYGGSSVLSSFLMFGVIQGLYILKAADEEEMEDVLVEEL